jgi:hypothetical protein
MNKVVVDADSLSKVFDKTNKEHREYEPLHKSIIEQKRSLIVYGGTKYANELKRARKFLRLFAELGKVGLALMLDAQGVDDEEQRIIGLANDPKFNDHHIVAIVVVGRCNIICSSDRNSHGHYKNSLYYPRHLRPKIYNGLASSGVLN